MSAIRSSLQSLHLVADEDTKMIIKIRRPENDKKGYERESDARFSAAAVEPFSACLSVCIME
jgi:hypothetical protein